jgi:hypothetical protein
MSSAARWFGEGLVVATRARHLLRGKQPEIPPI